jgi:hypothetical protein
MAGVGWLLLALARPAIVFVVIYCEERNINVPEADNTGVVRILTERGGTVAEISDFLQDLETAYLAIYHLDRAWSHRWGRRHMMFEFFMETGFPYLILPGTCMGALTPTTVLPEHRLVIKSVRIESPGFWEGRCPARS